MALSAFSEVFTNLSGWTASGMTAASNAVRATTGGALGYIKKTHYGAGNAGNNFEMRLSFDIIPDKTDTSGRYIGAGQGANDLSSGAFGSGVFYVAGTGIRVGAIFNGALQSPVTLLADASITTGLRYHIEATFVWGGVNESTHAVYVQIYNRFGQFVTGARSNGISVGVGYYSGEVVYITGTSATSTVSKFTFIPGFFQSSSDLFANQVAVAVREQGTIGTGTALSRTLIAAPGGPIATINDKPIVCVNCRGSGTHDASLGFNSSPDGFDRTGYSSDIPSMCITFAALSHGMIVLYPYGYSNDHVTAGGPGVNHWGDDDAYNHYMYWINTYMLGLYPSGYYLILAGYSMGGTIVGRLISDGQISTLITIRGVGFFRAVTSVRTAGYLDGSFDNQVRRCWMSEATGSGITNPTTGPASYSNNGSFTSANADSLWNSHDAHYTSQYNSGRWSRVLHPVYIDHSSADSTVLSSLYATPFKTALTAGGISYTENATTDEGHTDFLNFRSVNNFLETAIAPVSSEITSTVTNTVTVTTNESVKTVARYNTTTGMAAAGVKTIVNDGKKFVEEITEEKTRKGATIRVIHKEIPD